MTQLTMKVKDKMQIVHLRYKPHVLTWVYAVKMEGQNFNYNILAAYFFSIKDNRIILGALRQARKNWSAETLETKFGRPQLSVVYFNQHTSAAHPSGWLKCAFLLFFNSLPHFFRKRAEIRWKCAEMLLSSTVLHLNAGITPCENG